MNDRQIAGLWCSDILESFGEYLEENISEVQRVAVAGHLANCETCSLFKEGFLELLTRARNTVRNDNRKSDALVLQVEKLIEEI